MVIDTLRDGKVNEPNETCLWEDVKEEWHFSWVWEEELTDNTQEQQKENTPLVADEGGRPTRFHEGACEERESDLGEVPRREEPENDKLICSLEELDVNPESSHNHPEEDGDFQNDEVVNEETKPVGFHIESIDL